MNFFIIYTEPKKQEKYTVGGPTCIKAGKAPSFSAFSSYDVATIFKIVNKLPEEVINSTDFTTAIKNKLKTYDYYILFNAEEAAKYLMSKDKSDLKYKVLENNEEMYN